MSDNRMTLLIELCRILRDYGLNTDNAWTDGGRVALPGKLEGEPIETLYYYSATLNGMGEDVGDWSVHGVDATERQVFGFAPETAYIAIREDGNGFVHRAEMTEREYAAWCDVVQEDDSDEA